MGNSEETKSSMLENTSSPARYQPNLHVYPDWTAMQVYYGPRVPVPPYFNSPVATGHLPPPPHPYMWGPLQPMMPPYGPPYAAIYAHGSVHPHPGVPMGSPASGHGVVPTPLTSEAMVAIPLGIETPSKPLANVEQGLMKGYNGLTMSIGSGNAQSGVDSHGRSQSEEAEGSSDGSNENPVFLCPKGKKRNREKSPHKAEERKHAALRSSLPSEEVVVSCGKVMTPVDATEKVGPALSPKMTMALELGNACGLLNNVKAVPSNAPQPCPAIPSEVWMQDEKDLKLEKRKQSNRESARRSRLRKQAEAEELGKKVKILSGENMTLVSEINEVKGNSELLRLENARLMEKLQKAKFEQTVETSLSLHDTRAHPIGTADLLARVNNSGSVVNNNISNDEYEMFENYNNNKNKNSGAKLRQLLDAGPRADVVAAG